jgi:hypothetical protein
VHLQQRYVGRGLLGKCPRYIGASISAGATLLTPTDLEPQVCGAKRTLYLSEHSGSSSGQASSARASSGEEADGGQPKGGEMNGGDPPQADEVEGSEGWSCSACTYRNLTLVDECAMCGESPSPSYGIGSR